MRYKIEIFNDTNALNPFEYDDYLPTVIYKYPRMDIQQDEKYWEVINCILEKLDFNKDFYKIYSLISEYSYYDYDYMIEMMEESKRIDAVIDAIRDKISIDVLHDLLNFAGITNKYHVSKGFSQGDVSHVLFILTDELKEEYPDLKEDELFNEAIRLYDAFAWNNFHGFRLYKKVHFTKVYDDGEKHRAFEWCYMETFTGFVGFDTEAMKKEAPPEAVPLFNSYKFSDIFYD